MARSLLLILLIALLPLRGWSADFMTASMAASEVSSQAMPEDCPMKHAAGADDAKAAHGCQCCQLCAPLAAMVMPTPRPVPLAAADAVLTQAERFVSAELPRAAEPPIS